MYSMSRLGSDRLLFYHSFNLIKTKHSPNNNQSTKSNEKLANTSPWSRWWRIFGMPHSHLHMHTYVLEAFLTKQTECVFILYGLWKSVLCLLFACLCLCNFAQFHKNEIFSQDEMNEFWFIVCMTFWKNWKWIRCVCVCMFCLIKFIYQQLKLWFFKSNANQKPFSNEFRLI